jgi:hypothetical protein
MLKVRNTDRGENYIMMNFMAWGFDWEARREETAGKI